MWCSIRRIAVSLIILGALSVSAAPTEPWTMGSCFPSWASVTPTRTIQQNYIAGRSSTENGDTLAARVAALQAGDKLEIGAGTWSVNRWWNVVLHGTEAAPIWITAAPGASVVITRPNESQNVMNVAAAAGDTTTFVCFRGLEFTGGGALIRLYRCANVWVDSCTIHNGNGVGITANSTNCEYLFITRNHIYHPGRDSATSEGMYLGANYGASVMRYSVVALNHVHDCGGTQGDGIELKQGSYNNWIVQNHVHDCNYPCILVYGTAAAGINVVERNVIYRSNDNAMQVQGEAIVANNLVVSGSGAAFASTDHQDQTLNLTVVHNTFVNNGTVCNFSSWNNRAGMVFANNVAYSQGGTSLRFPNGSAGVTIAGNVTLGQVSGVSSGFVAGNGLQDFVDLAWDGSALDGRPVTGSPMVGAADAAFAVSVDFNGILRAAPHDAGAFLNENAGAVWRGRRRPPGRRGPTYPYHSRHFRGRQRKAAAPRRGLDNVPQHRGNQGRHVEVVAGETVRERLERVIETSHRQVLGNAYAALPRMGHRHQRGPVVDADQDGGRAVEHGPVEYRVQVRLDRPAEQVGVGVVGVELVRGRVRGGHKPPGEPVDLPDDSAEFRTGVMGGGDLLETVGLTRRQILDRIRQSGRLGPVLVHHSDRYAGPAQMPEQLCKVVRRHPANPHDIPNGYSTRPLQSLIILRGYLQVKVQPAALPLQQPEELGVARYHRAQVTDRFRMRHQHDARSSGGYRQVPRPVPPAAGLEMARVAQRFQRPLDRCTRCPAPACQQLD